jgi:hypothetical protein
MGDLSDTPIIKRHANGRVTVILLAVAFVAATLIVVF